MREQPQLRGGTVLDVCTGSGAIAISAALGGARSVTAVDVSRRAVLTVRLNARLNGVRVEAVRGDLLGAVPGRRFDVIVSNPPYLPADDDALPARGSARHTEAGTTGRILLDRLIDAAPDHLAPGGVLLVTHSSVNGEEATLARMRAAGLDVAVAERRRGDLGPLLAARAPQLEARGLLAPGDRTEDILVVAGAA
jgi:release factor glutamine methyltransferase